MAELKFNVHVRYSPDFGPASRFIPPNLDVQEKADDGGGQPSEPKALVFTSESGDVDVFIMSEQTRKQLVAMLTGGIVVTDSVELHGGGGAGGGPLGRGGNGR